MKKNFFLFFLLLIMAQAVFAIPSPQHYYSFEDSDFKQIDTGVASHLNATAGFGTIRHAISPYGYAINTTGATNSSIFVAPIDSFVSGLGYTFTLRYLRNTNGTGFLFDFRSGSIAGRGVYIEFLADGDIIGCVETACSTYDVNSSANEWHYLLFTHNRVFGSPLQLRVYLDDIFIGSTNAPLNGGYASTLCLGSQSQSGSVGCSESGKFNGSISEFGFYNTILSDVDKNESSLYVWNGTNFTYSSPPPANYTPLGKPILNHPSGNYSTNLTLVASNVTGANAWIFRQNNVIVQNASSNTYLTLWTTEGTFNFTAQAYNGSFYGELSDVYEYYHFFSDQPINQTTYFGQMEADVCPDTMANVTNMLFFIIFAMGLTMIGFIYHKALGIFGGLALLFTSFSISACHGMVGFILGLTGVVLIVIFAFRK